MSKNGPAAAAAKAGMQGFSEIDDAVDRGGRLQLQAFRTLNLKADGIIERVASPVC